MASDHPERLTVAEARKQIRALAPADRGGTTGTSEGDAVVEVLAQVDDALARVEAAPPEQQGIPLWSPPPGPPGFHPTECPEGHPLRWLTHEVATCGNGRVDGGGCGLMQHWRFRRESRGPWLLPVTDPATLGLAWVLSQRTVGGAYAGAVPGAGEREALLVGLLVRAERLLNSPGVRGVPAADRLCQHIRAALAPNGDRGTRTRDGRPPVAGRQGQEDAHE